MIAHNGHDQRSTRILIAATLQGLALLLLHHARAGGWSIPIPWLLACYTFVITAPTLLMMSFDRLNIRRALLSTLAFSLTISALVLYVGHQLPPSSSPNQFHIIFVLAATLLVAAFKALMYIQVFADHSPLTYSRLFLFSWRNLIILSLALLFTLAFDGILILSGSLFKAVGIQQLMAVITSPYFYYPVLAITNGIGITTFQKQVGVIDTITRIQQALMKLLLVLLVLISSTFLLVLLFTGLSALWKNGGSALIFTMQALMLFFLNSVYQDDPETRPYSLWIHRLIYGGIAILPIYSLISIYGLSLRIEQYGWSVSRCWAFLLWAVLAGFSLQYLFGIFRLRDRWMHSVSRVNVRMGLIVLALMLLVNSPLLDFRKITVNNQIARLEAGKIALEDLDLRQFSRALGNPGYNALQQLKDQYGEDHPEIAAQITKIYNQRNNANKPLTQHERISTITFLDDAPDDLKKAIHIFSNQRRWKFNNIDGLWLLRADMDGIPPEDYVLVNSRDWRIELTLFYKQQGNWKNRELRHSDQRDSTAKANKKFYRALTEGDYKSTESTWRALRIGEEEFDVW